MKDSNQQFGQEIEANTNTQPITPGDNLGDSQNKLTINMENFQSLELELDKLQNEWKGFLSDPKNRVWVNDLDDSIRD